jgi:hypothetical protein
MWDTSRSASSRLSSVLEHRLTCGGDLTADWLRAFAGQAPAHLAKTRAATLMGSLLSLEGVVCVLSLISSFDII